MRTDVEIKMLIDRFFDAETSLSEEQKLYDYFSNEDVAPELEQYRELFRGFKAIELPRAVMPVAEDRHRRVRRSVWKSGMSVLAVAASVAALVVMALFIRLDKSDECVAYLNGKKCTDEHVVMDEMENVMHGIMRYEPQTDVDKQMYDMFNRQQ